MCTDKNKHLEKKNVDMNIINMSSPPLCFCGTLALCCDASHTFEEVKYCRCLDLKKSKTKQGVAKAIAQTSSVLPSLPKELPGPAFFPLVVPGFGGGLDNMVGGKLGSLDQCYQLSPLASAHVLLSRFSGHSETEQIQKTPTSPASAHHCPADPSRPLSTPGHLSCQGGPAAGLGL